MKTVLAILILLTLFSMMALFYRKRAIKQLVENMLFFLWVLFNLSMSVVLKPIFVLFVIHLALVVLLWGGLFVFLFQRRLIRWILFAPLVTLTSFYFIAWLGGAGA
jgi:hypothetical protein